MPRTPAPEVDVAGGRLRGSWKNKGAVAVFRNVPFAAPPVGERRWKPPAPAEPWTGVRNATKDGATAVQRATMFEVFLNSLVQGQGWNPARTAALSMLVNKAPKPKASEDCLHLTVRTPQPSPGESVTEDDSNLSERTHHTARAGYGDVARGSD